MSSTEQVIVQYERKPGYTSEELKKLFGDPSERALDCEIKRRGVVEVSRKQTVVFDPVTCKTIVTHAATVERG